MPAKNALKMLIKNKSKKKLGLLDLAGGEIEIPDKRACLANERIMLC
jgi:hypothetical protein